jgi:Fic family protein
LNSFVAVTKSVEKVLEGASPGEVAEEDLQGWYRELFAPLVKSGLLQASELAGYRNHQVYIAGSRHVPPSASAVLDTMETLFDLLKHEPEPGVRAVLGHFVFVTIHPYMDGNGRIGR